MILKATHIKPTPVEVRSSKNLHFLNFNEFIPFGIVLFLLMASTNVFSQAFITTWKSDNTGASSATQVTIPTSGGTGFSYDINWFEISDPAHTGTLLTQTGDATIDFVTAGIYQVEITGTFPRFNFGFGFNDAQKLLTVEQWGSNQWTSMETAFNGCTNLTIPAVDAPDLSNVISMQSMFMGCSSFDEPIDHWDVSTIQNMDQLFSGASSFNQDLSSWVVTNVISSYYMFGDATVFNQDIGGWDMRSSNMAGMFANAIAFNQDISNWDVSNNTSLFSMFEGATSFNRDISSWVVSNVSGMGSMFSGATSFNQNLGSWDISSVGNFNSFFSNSGLSRSNYDQTLIGWASLPFLQSTVLFGADGLTYCSSNSVRSTVFSSNGWGFSGDNLDCTQKPFITRWKTDNDGDSGPTQVLIPVPSTPIGFGYDIYWEEVGNPSNNNTIINQTGAYTIEFGSAGTYDVSISGTFPHFTFQGGTGDHDKLLSVEQWGDNQWTTTANMFRSASNMVINATDVPDLSQVSTMIGMFYSATSMNSDLNNWDVSNVTDMRTVFANATSFNSDLDNWDVSNVTTMNMMFWLASSFNGDITSWNTHSVTDMESMFPSCKDFNQDISGWDVDSVTDMSDMFQGCEAFNQPIGVWEVDIVTDMSGMFFRASAFNQDLNSWNTSNVVDMNRMFRQATAFNGDVSSWDVTGVEDMTAMFWLAGSFNQDISNWQTSAVKNMSLMFQNATVFNQDISSWNTLNVEDMSNMFNQADSFNQDISGWQVGNVTTMNQMFRSNDVFNQDLSTWDVRKVQDFNRMFEFATSFDQSLGGWDVVSGTDFTNILTSSALTSENYDQTLTGWVGLPSLQFGVTFGVGDVTYCAGESDKDYLESSLDWTITDGGLDCPEANLVSVYPGQNALSVSRDTEIGMKFSEDMDFSTITSNTVFISGSLSGIMPGTFSVGTTDSVVFLPDAQLKPGEVVSISITNQLYTQSSIQVDTTFTWQFTAEVDGGDGYFIAHSSTLGTHQSQGLAVGDVNDDGDIDVYVSNDGATGLDINKVYLNDGTGVFTPTSQSLSANNGRKVAFVDMDVNGSLDILETNSSAASNNMWMNDGTGLFAQNAQTFGITGNAIEGADFNGDGYPDAIVAFDGDDRLYLNDNALSLTSSGQLFSSENTNDIGIGDFDNDGDLDFVLADEGSGNSVWINDGAGNFTFNGGLSGAITNAVAVGDLNGDGFLDLYFANGDANDEVFFGNGAGTFNLSSQTLSALLNTEAALGDIDGDGDLDVVLVNNNVALANTVWLNDGVGQFVELSGFEFGTSTSARDVKLGDIDNDGDLDILTVSGDGQGPNAIWLNEPAPCVAPLLVTSVADNGACGTLRYAVEYANSTIGSDTITFAISNDTIRLDSTITIELDSATVIDGGNSNIVIAPSGEFQSGEDLIIVSSREVLLLNLSFYGTSPSSSTAQAGVEFNGFADHSIVNNVTIQGCEGTGIIVKGGNTGIQIINVTAFNNVESGLFLESGVDSAVVKGCVLGVDANKQNGGNQFVGVLSGATNTQIGGAGPGEANIIAGNDSIGIYIGGETPGGSASVVKNNFIGVDSDSSTAIPNGAMGILIGISNVAIGDSTTGVGNVVAYNGSHGIYIVDTIDSVTIHHNLIFSNDSLGISYRRVSPPVIQTTSTEDVSGTASGDAYIQVYGTSNDEGDVFLGSTVAAADGSWIYDLSADNISQLITNGIDSLTALQDSANTTSAFSDAAHIDLQSICLDELEVTSTNDDLTCGTLRFAIDYANNNPGKDTITFNISVVGPHVIKVIDSSYVVTDPIFIDGYSQTGATVNSGDDNFDADIMITLDGSLQTVPGDAIRFESDSNTVKGIRIINFRNEGSAALYFDQSNHNRVVGNMIGLDVDHTDPSRNYYGIYLDQSSDNQIGDTANADRNIVVWSDYSGIFSNASADNNIVNNYIGMGPGIFSGYGNGVDGISLENGSSGAIIYNNVICDNDSAGIYIDASSHDHTILSNTIGMNYENQIIYSNMAYGGLAIWGHHNQIGDGTFEGSNIIAGNEDAEIYLAGKHNDVQFNYIGTIRDSSFIDHGVDGIKLIAGADSNSFFRNVIAHNDKGIWAESSSVQGNRYHGNSFFNNATAIVHETGAQLDAQPPVIDSTDLLIVDETFVIFYGHGVQESLIQLYADSVDQGQEFVDSVRVNSLGQWELWVNQFKVSELAADGLVKFTALQDFMDNTSPFSLPVTIGESALVPVITNVTYSIIEDSAFISWDNDTSRIGELYTVNYGTNSSSLSPVDSIRNDTSKVISYTNGIEQYISVTITDSISGNSVTSSIIALPYIAAPAFSGAIFCVTNDLSISLSGFGLDMSTQTFTVYISDSVGAIVDTIDLPSNSEVFDYPLSSLMTDNNYSIQVIGNESQIYSGVSVAFSVTNDAGGAISAVDDEFNVTTHNVRKIDISKLLENDDVDLASIVSVGTAQFGTVNLTESVVTYQSNSRFTGVDSFTYTVGGGCYIDELATVKLNVSYLEQSNDSVVGGNSNITTVNISIDVSQLTDPDTVFIVYGPTSGSPLVIDTANFSFIVDYNNSSFYGYDTIVYEVCAGPDCFQGLKVIQRDSVSGPLIVEFDENKIQVNVFNAVSPNGDEHHEYLDLEFSYEDGTIVKITDKLVQVRIYNMWGDIIYSEDAYDVADPERRWSGQSTLTGEAISGTYYYSMEIEYTNENGRRKFFKHPGFVLLKRE